MMDNAAAAAADDDDDDDDADEAKNQWQFQYMAKDFNQALFHGEFEKKPSGDKIQMLVSR